MRKKLSIIILALTALTFSVNQANAQEALRTFTISPPTVQVTLSPGESTEGKLKIINDGSTSLNFTTSIRDFIVEDNIGTPKILPQNTLSNKYSGASWIGIYPTKVYVSPKQKTEFNYYIQVPMDARPGGHYAAVMYTPTTVIGDDSSSGAAVNTSVGSLIYITVKGPITEKATVTNFSTKRLWENGPAEISHDILNVSDAHIKPTGTVTLKNMIGGISEVKKIDEYNIFPGVSRNYKTKIGKGFMIGYYKAEFKGIYGTNGSPLNASLSFFVFPWKIAAFIVLTAVAILIGYRYWKKDKKGHSEDPSAPQPPLN